MQIAMLAENKVLSVASPAWLLPRCGGGGIVGPFRRISEELDEAQGWHTQCEHPEGKGMRDSGNAISKKN